MGRNRLTLDCLLQPVTDGGCNPLALVAAMYVQPVQITGWIHIAKTGNVSILNRNQGDMVQK